jgi:competence protein ComEC
MFGFCIIFMLFGILRYQIIDFNIKNDKLSKYNSSLEKIILYGKVIDEPVKKDTLQNIKFKVESILINSRQKEISGTVLLTTSRYPEYNYQDNIKVEGKLKTPDVLDDFNYKNYLMKDGIYSVMAFPKIVLLQKNACEKLICSAYSGILWLKQKLRESIRANYLPPESLVLEGTILGDNSALTADLKTKLNITGLRHIIAVSGTHVIILSIILMSLLLSLGFYRGQAFYISVTFIWLYIILTGLPASGVRAGIMATIFLFAEKIGRQSHTERIIVLTASVILFLNPLLLFYDVGFQLSFLAVLGLIYLQQPITEFLNFIINKAKNLLLLKSNERSILVINKKEKRNEKLDNILNMFSATLAAQIFTLPIMLYNFGNISLVAPITNMLILPVVEPLMILGFISSFLGIIVPWLGAITAVPCYFLLFYFVKILDIFSAPYFIKTFENVHWAWVIILYFLIICLVAFIKKHHRESNFF